MHKVKISLPNWLVILLNEYEKEGYIEINKFIAGSISDFINIFNLDKDCSTHETICSKLKS